MNKKSRKILFFIEPIFGGLILFPIIALFWECGWNLVQIYLNYLNTFPLNYQLDKTIPKNLGIYNWQSLVSPYLIVQFLLLLYYLCQNLFYNFFKKRRWILKNIFLQFHIFILAAVYIIQWKILWTIWDEFTPNEWYFRLSLSIGSLFAIIVFNGHLSDLVCSPFLLSYDSIEYCIHFGCSLLTREVRFLSILKD